MGFPLVSIKIQERRWNHHFCIFRAVIFYSIRGVCALSLSPFLSSAGPWTCATEFTAFPRISGPWDIIFLALCWFSTPQKKIFLPEFSTLNFLPSSACCQLRRGNWSSQRFVPLKRVNLMIEPSSDIVNVFFPRYLFLIFNKYNVSNTCRVLVSRGPMKPFCFIF